MTERAEQPAPATQAPPPTPAAIPPIVSFDKVTKTYDNGFTAIKDVTFTVADKPDEMEFITILGPSGCGKSTTLGSGAGEAGDSLTNQSSTAR